MNLFANDILADPLFEVRQFLRSDCVRLLSISI